MQQTVVQQRKVQAVVHSHLLSQIPGDTDRQSHTSTHLSSLVDTAMPVLIETRKALTEFALSFYHTI